LRTFARCEILCDTHSERDGKEGTMKVGARNRIVGKVTEIDKGKIMCFVKLDIPAKSKMGSVMTLESLKELKLKKGDEVEIIVKAVNVLLIKT
jgi:molybdopterin-binding protein